MPVMPKGRYKIMTAYMPKVGTLGLDMMYRTCTVQTNHDFSSEADMVKKLRVTLALQPVATALFANSPFTEGKPNGFLSFRSEIWRDTDNAARRHAAVGVRARHGLRALRRLRARRADVFRQARRQLHRRVRQIVPRSSRRQAHSRRARHHLGLGQPRLDDLSGGAAQALHRDARLRRRAVAAAAVAAGVLGRPDLRRRQSRCLLGDREGLDRRGAPEAARRRAEARLQGHDPRPQPARDRHARRCARRDRGWSAASGSTATAATRRAICGRCRRSWRAASRRPRSCWQSTTGRGTARSSRSSTNTRIESCCSFASSTACGAASGDADSRSRHGGYSAACAASDRLSSDEMMCSASASASARLSCGLRMSPTRQPGSSGKAVAGIEHAHAGPQSRFREHRNRQPRQHRGGHRAGVGAGVGDVMRPADRLQAFDRGAPPAAARPAERERQRLLEMRRMPVRRHPQQPLAAEHLRRARGAAVGDDGEIELVASRSARPARPTARTSR